MFRFPSRRSLPVASPNAPLPPPRRRWLRRLGITAVVGLVLFTLLGFFVVPVVARRVAERQLGDLLGRRVTLAGIHLNPYALALTLDELTVYEADGVHPFVSFARLFVNAEWASLFQRGPVVKELRLEKPTVHVVRLKETAEAWADLAAYNFSDIVARLAARPKSPEPPAPPTPGPPPRFSLNNLQIVDGLFTFDDQPVHAHHEIADLNVGLPFLSTLPVYLDAFVEPGVRLRVDGTPFVLKGRTKPFKESLETTLDLRWQDWDLTRYLSYVPVPLRFDVESAKLSVALAVSFARTAKGEPKVTAAGTVALDDLRVLPHRPARTPDRAPAPLFALKRFEVELGEADLLKQAVHVRHVTLDGLEARARRLRDGTLDWQHLVPTTANTPARKPQKPHASPAATGPAPAFRVDEVRLSRAKLHLDDETTTPSFALGVDDLDLIVKGLSNARGSEAEVAFSFALAPGGKVSHQGKLGLAPLHADGELTWEGIRPAAFAPYYRDRIAFDVTQGEVGLGSTYHFAAGAAGAAPALKLARAFVVLKDLALKRPGKQPPFFALGELAVRDVGLDLAARTVEVGSITTRDGKLRAARDPRGALDLASLLAPAAPGDERGRDGEGASAEKTAPAGARTTASATAPADAAGPADAGPDWTVAVNDLTLQKWGLRFDDQTVSPPATLTIDPIGVHVSHLSTAPRSRANLKVTLGLNKTGRLEVSGDASLTPLTGRFDIALSSLAVLPFQPYFANFVKLTVTSGALSVKGRGTFEAARSPKDAPPVTFDGDIDLGDFACVERPSGDPLLSFVSFHVGGLHVATAPQAVAIKEIALTDFRSRVVMRPDATLNVQDLAATSEAQGAARPSPASASSKPSHAAKPALTQAGAASGPATAPAGPPITIGQITLQGGHVSYHDALIQPPVTAELTDLGGRLSSLSTDPATRADVDLRGAVNHSGALSIQGTANPLAHDLALDVKIALNDFELPPTSPYAAKFAGYGIAKGKLDLSLAYRIAGGKLDASNHLVLEQFTFGDKVDSPDALKLPVKLAVAILKDRHGVIDIDLPISGSLDDPQFKIGRLILKTLGNLIVKAATAPFSLLASAFGGGDEMSHLSFVNGLATLDGAANARISSLAKVIRERPGLSFELEGSADPQTDREGLRRFLTERKLKLEKMNDLVKQGLSVPNVDALPLTAEERPLYLARAYKAAPFPKPRNAVGLEKTLSPEEQERLLLSNTTVTDDDLRALALRRATVVQSALTRLAPESAARIFLVTPKVAAAGSGGRSGDKTGGATGHEVECKLKQD
jgi:hypothetical protein